MPSNQRHRVFLFLQGPITPFFKLVADGLEKKRHRVLRINLCFGDWLFWRRAGATNYRGTLGDWPAFISHYLDQEDVTDLVLIGEQRDYHKVAIAEAKKRGIQIITTDFGYLRSDWITLELNGMSAESLFPRIPQTLFDMARPLPAPDLSPKYRDSFFIQALWDMAYHLSNVLLHVLYPFYQTHQLYHPALVYLGTGWHLLHARLVAKKTQALIDSLHNQQTPYFLFPLQMQNDYQIRAYSKYGNLEAAIDEVIGSFAKQAPGDSLLIVKVHPLDPFLVDWQRHCQQLASKLGIKGRVLFIDGGPLKSLLEHARGVVTINSTVGLWSLLAGRPLIALGSSIYNIEGLVHMGSLDGFWQQPTAPDTALRDAFITVLAATIQLRGVYYHNIGLAAAVSETVARLHTNQINQPH